MRWRKYVVGMVALAVLAWSAIAIAQNLAEREARTLLDAWVATPPQPFTAFKYGAVRFDVTERRLIVSKIELTGPQDTDRVTIGSVSIADPQPLVLDRVVNPGRYRDGKGQGDFAQAASQMRISDIRVESSDGETTVAEVNAEAVALRQFTIAPTAANFGDEAGKIIGIVVPGIRASEIVITGLVHRRADGSEGGAIARIGVRGIDAGRVAEARADELRFLENNKDAVTVASTTVVGVDLTRALPEMAAGRVVSGSDPTRKPRFDHWELRALGGPTLAENGISVVYMTADVSRAPDDATERVTIKVGGIDVTPPTQPDSPVAAVMSGLGYSALSGSITCISDSDNLRKTWTVSPCALSMPGAGTVSLAYALSGFNVEAPVKSESADAALAAFAAASLNWFRLGFTDDGLTTRAIAYSAQTSGQPEAAFRQELIAQVQQGAEMYGSGSPRIRAVANAVATFLTKPAALTVALEPAAPVSFGSLDAGLLTDPAGAAERLGLTARNAP